VARQVEVKHPNWLELSPAEQESLVRGHTQHCFNHIRNIFLKPMSAAQSAHVRDSLQQQLERFSSWERMETDFENLLRAVYKVSPTTKLAMHCT
jgi:arabinogalactan endo-1,4-beta-galactosidase